MIYIELTERQQLEVVERRIELYKAQLSIITRVLELLPKFEGKKITKAIETYLRKNMPNNYLYKRDIGSMFYINISPSDKYEHEKMMQILIGYSNNPYIVMEKVKDYNQCYTLNAERLVKLEAGKKHIYEIIKKRNQAIKLLNEVETIAEQYGMDYDFKLSK